MADRRLKSACALSRRKAAGPLSADSVEQLPGLVNSGFRMRFAKREARDHVWRSLSNGGPHNEITTSCKEMGALTTLFRLFLQRYNFGVFQQNPPIAAVEPDFAVLRK